MSSVNTHIVTITFQFYIKEGKKWHVNALWIADLMAVVVIGGWGGSLENYLALQPLLFFNLCI